MVKKVVSLCVTFLMAFSVVFADDVTEIAQEQTKEEVKVYKITLNDAIEMAITNSPQLLANEVKKQNYETQLKSAKIAKSSADDYRVVSASSGYEAIYVMKGYYVEMYSQMVNLSDDEYKKTAATISYNVTQKYYNYKICEKLLDIAEKSYTLVNQNYENAKISYDLGLISKNDLDNAEVSMKQAQYMVESYKNNLEIAKEDFKISLRKNDENCEFVLTDEITCENYDGNIAQDLLTAKSSRYDIKSLKSNYDLAKMYLDFTGLPSNTAIYTSAYSNYITAEYNYTNNTDLILLGVKSAYNNISLTKNNLDLAERNLKLKNNSYNISKVKYEQGMITNSELSTVMNEVAQAEIEVENAKLAYKLAVEKYKYEISTGL